MDGYVYGEQPSDPQVIKLNTNENPYPPSPAVAEALASFDVAGLRKYPVALSDALRAQIASQCDLDPSQVLITNGGDEAIRLLATACLSPNDLMVASEPGYSLYPVMCAIQDARYRPMELSTEYKPPPDAALRCVAQQAKLVCIPNPNAPSGVLLTRAEIDDFACRYRNMLLIDEAYVDFVEPDLEHDLTKLLSRHRHLMLLRTFSKGYSLAGARVGYLLGDADAISMLSNKVRDSYNVNTLSQTIALAALGDQAHALSSWQKVRRERERVARELQKMGYSVPNSQANFVLPTSASKATMRPIFEQLRERKILVRHFNTDRLRSSLRVSIGTPAENDALLRNWNEIVRGQQ